MGTFSVSMEFHGRMLAFCLRGLVLNEQGVPYFNVGFYIREFLDSDQAQTRDGRPDGTSRTPAGGMADPNWRRPPSSSGGVVPFGAPNVQQQQEGVPTNGQHGGRGSQFPAPNQPKFHSSTGVAIRTSHTPQGGTFAPPSQGSLVGKKTAHQLCRCVMRSGKALCIPPMQRLLVSV